MIGVRLRKASPGPLRDNGWVVIECKTENFSVEKEQAEAGCQLPEIKVPKINSMWLTRWRRVFKKWIRSNKNIKVVPQTKC